MAKTIESKELYLCRCNPLVHSNVWRHDLEGSSSLVTNDSETSFIR